jgi:hypothetical protein
MSKVAGSSLCSERAAVPHVFRYVALSAYSARHPGFPISDAGLSEIVYGDVGGAIIALTAITALRLHSREAIPAVWC